MVVKLFTDTQLPYGVHVPSAFVFHPLNVALDFVNVFELKFLAVPYVILVSAIFQIHPFALYLILYVLADH